MLRGSGGSDTLNAGIGADISVFDKRPEHEALFEHWVYPHTKHLARFLLEKARDGRVSALGA